MNKHNNTNVFKIAHLMLLMCTGMCMAITETEIAVMEDASGNVCSVESAAMAKKSGHESLLVFEAGKGTKTGGNPYASDNRKGNQEFAKEL